MEVKQFQDFSSNILENCRQSLGSNARATQPSSFYLKRTGDYFLTVYMEFGKKTHGCQI